jgi:hypothetical protein
MSELTRTPGEIVFEKFLDFHQIPFDFEKEYPGKSKRPDYSIEWEGSPVVFDVKDFDPPDTFPMGFGAFDPYPPIREKIAQGRKKFKEYKEYCCGLVLFNAGRPLIFLDGPDIMLGSMYGDSGFTFPVDTQTGIGDASQMKQAFLGRGKMIQPHWKQPENTTISAIVVVDIIQPFMIELTELMVEDNTVDWEAEMKQRIPDFDPNLQVPRVIVWHNAFARIPFPPNLFCGRYDTHYGVHENYQGVTFEGSALPDRLKLSRPRTLAGRSKKES